MEYIADLKMKGIHLQQHNESGGHHSEIIKSDKKITQHVLL